MHKKIKKMVQSEVQVPDVVLQATENALSMIPENEVKDVSITRVTTFKKNRKKWVVCALVAVLVFGTLGVTADTDVFNNLLLEHIGVNNKEISELNLGEMNIVTSDTTEGISYAKNTRGKKETVTMMISEAIGDDSTAYFRVDFDMEIPEGIVDKIRTIKYETMSINVYEDEGFSQESEDYVDVSSKLYFEEGKIAMVYKIETENITEKFFQLQWNNLIMVQKSDPSKYVSLFDGAWNATFSFDYEAKEPIVLNISEKIIIKDAEFEHFDGTRVVRESSVSLEKIEINPTTITLYGELDFEPENECPSFILFSIDKITFTDGTVYEYKYTGKDDFKYNCAFQYHAKSTAVVSKNNLFELFGHGVDPDQIESVTINGVDFSFH